ncbi:unnamed protein product [Staurois parvus]|uniref:Uncharacterized protein n=1 Tax=Staurois parvus TaxID=386267 RepID=A0ABN9HQN9_9NEOB|nr:unnamed protein product [Staurois parvus]
MGPCRAPQMLLSHRHTLPCATFRSPHTPLVSILSKVALWPPIAAATTATLCLQTLVFEAP